MIFKLRLKSVSVGVIFTVLLVETLRNYTERRQILCMNAENYAQSLASRSINQKLWQLKAFDVFDFEKLEVYQEMRGVNLKVLKHLFTQKADIDPYLQDQFKRASLSALLNLAEGTGRMTGPDKKKFYITARSSVFECVAILQIMFDTHLIEKSLYDELYSGFEKISRMLLGMIRSLD